MTDETAPNPDAAAPAPSPESAPTPTLEPASASPLHALAADLHALLARVDSLEHEVKQELASGLAALLAKLKVAL